MCVLSPTSRSFWGAQIEMANVVSSHSTTSRQLGRLTMASQLTERLTSVGHPSAFLPGPLVMNRSIKEALSLSSRSLPTPLPACLALLGSSLRSFDLPVSERVQA